MGSPFILELMIDNTGNLWIGTLNHGLFFIENVHQVKKTEDTVTINYHYLPNVHNSLSSIDYPYLYQDGSRYASNQKSFLLWLSSSGSLLGIPTLVAVNISPKTSGVLATGTLWVINRTPNHQIKGN